MNAVSSLSLRGAPSTLAELVAPLTEAEFLTSLRQRKLVHLRLADGRPPTQLLGWEELQHLVQHASFPHREYFRVLRESKPAPIERWMTAGKVDMDRLEDCLRDGFSIIVTHIELHLPSLEALCRDLSARLLEQTYVGAIVTTGAEGAFRLHYDFEDLIILQTEGRKRWQIFGPPVPNPLRGMVKPTPPQGTTPIFDQVLEPGKIFSLQSAGYWHHCQTVSGRSIHLGVFLLPPTGWDAAKALTSQLLAEELFRIPLTRTEDPTQLEAEVKARLIEKIGAMRLDEFPAEWTRTSTETRAREQRAREQERYTPMRNPGIRVVVDENSSATRPALDVASPAKREVKSGASALFLDNLSLQTLIAPVSTSEFPGAILGAEAADCAQRKSGLLR